VSSAGVQGNGDSYRPAITPDGRFVAFSSDASNLVSGDTNGVRDFFVHDRDPDENGVYDEPGLIETTRVNVSSSGAQADDASGIGTGDLCPAISDDGRYVAFYSLASNLVPFDENGTWDVFVHDRETMQTVRVSISAAGAEGNRSSALPQMTGDGRYVVYRSHADNLAANDTNGLRDIFLHDRDSDADEIYDEPGAIETRLISVNSAGALSNGHSNNPDISSDGRFVSYNSSSSNLVPVDFNYYTDVFVHDRATGETSLVSVGTEELSNGGSQRASISATGQHIAFRSVATNLVPDDTNGLRDGFVRDRGPISPPCPCDCEAPPDGTVDVGDFLALLAQWGNPGTCDCEDPPDGVVDVGDFLAILAAWGTCP
jgi:Tol biopolymer transport system component